MKNAVRWMTLVCALVLVAGIALAQAPAKVAGKWELSWEGRNGTQTSTVTFEQDGEKVKGTMNMTFGQQSREVPLEGTVKGKDLTFSTKIQTPNGEMTREYKAVVDGDTMKGSFAARDRTIEFTGKRAK